MGSPAPVAPAPAVRERPILFSAPMVKALLAGRKTVTRRLVKERHFRPEFHRRCSAIGVAAALRELAVLPCPFGQPGDRLWVRETWSPDHRDVYPCYDYVYAADGRVSDTDRREHINACTEAKRELGERDFECLACARFRWRPSIHMPRRASRLTLEVVSVRAERLHDITEEDAKAEGAKPIGITFRDEARGTRIVPSLGGPYRDGFRILWESINGAESWDVNPWVWRVEFCFLSATK
ncbi:hypothetical protein [Corallococcus sp. AS-1-6]|uniref:hypothetical protein n=1 Tax=Corallococcus sp. AS-1-6 TaxID=2874599 RepID=UPI001CBC401D|nr:hypothetical protein [Corallococcus sp. AS-1-6]MBZ4371445.1 hypothetical protein [Corallococcus sp. AS-1-6]